MLWLDYLQTLLPWASWAPLVALGSLLAGRSGIFTFWRLATVAISAPLGWMRGWWSRLRSGSSPQATLAIQPPTPTLPAGAEPLLAEAALGIAVAAGGPWQWLGKAAAGVWWLVTHPYALCVVLCAGAFFAGERRQSLADDLTSSHINEVVNADLTASTAAAEKQAAKDAVLRDIAVNAAIAQGRAEGCPWSPQEIANAKRIH